MNAELLGLLFSSPRASVVKNRAQFALEFVGLFDLKDRLDQILRPITIILCFESVSVLRTEYHSPLDIARETLKLEGQFDAQLTTGLYDYLVQYAPERKDRFYWNTMALLVIYFTRVLGMSKSVDIRRVEFVLRKGGEEGLIALYIARQLVDILKPDLCAPKVDFLSDLPSDYLTRSALPFDARRKSWIRNGPFHLASRRHTLHFPSREGFIDSLATRRKLHLNAQIKAGPEFPSLSLKVILGICLRLLINECTEPFADSAFVKIFVNMLPYLIKSRQKFPYPNLLDCSIDSWEEFSKQCADPEIVYTLIKSFKLDHFTYSEVCKEIK